MAPMKAAPAVVQVRLPYPVPYCAQVASPDLIPAFFDGGRDLATRSPLGREWGAGPAGIRAVGPPRLRDGLRQDGRRSPGRPGAAADGLGAAGHRPVRLPAEENRLLRTGGRAGLEPCDPRRSPARERLFRGSRDADPGANPGCAGGGQVGDCLGLLRAGNRPPHYAQGRAPGGRDRGQPLWRRFR